ncbi:MAG: aldehyde ferredoxin oxidoreductase family protein, partial [Candidatus Ranarchaeia archaeon]
MTTGSFENTVSRGKLLEVNLTSRTDSILEIGEKDARKWLGGVSLGLKILYERIPRNADPLGPENLLLVMAGPLTGTLCPGTRQVVLHKSPHTGLENNSYIGGGVGAAIKQAGYDGIIISGISETPVWLEIIDQKVSFNDASKYWGKDAFYTEEKLKRETERPNAKVLSIGQAGENLVTYACINTDYYSQAGRAGTGAVMGSKNLKALLVEGTQPVRHYDTKAFIEVAKEAHLDLRESSGIYRFRRWGTASSIKWASDRDLQPTYNFQAGMYEDIDKINQDVHENEFWVKDKACYGCPVGCKKLGVLKTGPYKGTVVEGAEYELATLLGANCGIKSLDLLIKANDLVDRYGLDGISTGVTIGWAIEAFKNGVFEQDTGGVALEWGEADTILGLIKQIAMQNTELGKLLGKGVKHAAELKGNDSEKYAMQVKGLELPGWGSRGSPSMALAYATSDRGGCHMRSFAIIYDVTGASLPNGTTGTRWSTTGKGEAVADEQNKSFAKNSLVSCAFTGGTINN